MFKDNIKSECISGMKFPKLKGHIKVALKDIRSGKTDIVFEGDNMITDAVSDIFASNLAGAMDYRKMLPLYSKMFGGILCFKNTLDVSSADAAKDYFIPDNGVNEVIAHAGQTTLTDQADDVTRGNPLSTAMTIADGAVTLAWEWGSSAGNGTIASVGLTHSDVGDAGTGSGSNAFKAMTPNINANYGLSASQKIYFVDKNGYGYTFTYSGTSVTLTRYPMAYRKVGLVGMPCDYVAGIPKSKTVTIGTSYSAFPYIAFNKETDKLYLFYNGSQSTTVYVDVINLSDWDNIPTPNHAEWTLDVAVGALNVGGSNAAPAIVPIYNGYVYLPIGQSNASGFVKVNLNSVADQIRMNASFKGSTGIAIPNVANRIIAGKCFVINDDTVYPTAIASPDVIADRNLYSVWSDTIVDSGIGLVNLAYLNTGSPQYYPSISKFYLATKFNLPTPITKTNNQSMVVTYTLTEVEEES